MKLYKSAETHKDASVLPRQAQIIFEEVHSRKLVSKDELFKSLEKRFFNVYNQPTRNIFAYYRGRLIKDGYMMEITV